MAPLHRQEIHWSCHLSACVDRWLATLGLRGPTGPIRAERSSKPGEPTVSFGEGAAAPSHEDVRDYSRKLRALQAKATPKTSLLPTIESSDPELANALLRLALVETAANHRMVAAAYRKAGVTDYAHQHYQRALRLEPCDSAALRGSGAGLARLGTARSRLWGMPIAR